MRYTEVMKQLREQSGLSIAKAAEALGMPKSTYSSYEYGRSEPDIETLSKISKHYGVSVDYLIGKSGTSDNPMLTAKQKEKIALEKWLNLDDVKRQAVLDVMESIIKAYELADEQLKEKTNIQITMSIKKSRYRTSAGIGYDLNDSDAWERVNVLDCPEARRADFIIEIDGDSMEPTYCNGENIFVKVTPDVRIGEIGIFTVNGKGYIKELGDGELISHNEKYDPIPLKDTENRCIGKVLGVAEIV